MRGGRVGRARRAVAVVTLIAGLGLVSPTQTSPVAAGPTAGRVLDQTAAYDATSGRWVSLASGESLSSQGATACAPVDPVIQSRGWLNVPFRTGPTPDKPRSCWEGDVLRDPPAGWWAAHEAGSVRAPTLLKRDGVWWLLYSARKADSQQRCIGVAASNQATGPWLHGSSALVCPTDGTSVDYPELHFDRASQKLYLLWVQAVGTGTAACSSQIKAQEYDTGDGVLVGTAATVLDASDPIVGFDEVADGACPGGVRHVVENPTMLRGDNGELWLLFSANDRNTVNYATGWALCGTGAPGSQGCAILNGFDPVQPARYRPMWGDGTRTAPVGGVDAKPYSGFPNYRGFGGLSVAVADPVGPPAGRTFVVGQLYWTGDQHLPLAYQVDTSQVAPGLYETEALAYHGTAGTFGSVATTPPIGTSPSGHGVATREVQAFGPAPGYEAIFNAVAANGTTFVSQTEQNRYFPTPTNDGMAVGAYDSATAKWTNVAIRWNRLSNKTTTGGTTLPAVHPDDYAPELPWEGASAPGAPVADDVRQVGASLGDVQEIDDGKAIAFVAPAGYPVAYGWLDGAGLPRPAGGTDGIWPSFGIVSQGSDGTWRVANGSGWVNQWTGGQLRTSVPRDPGNPSVPSISEQACPTTTNMSFGAPLSLPADESWCLHPNELDEFPDSRDLVVAQYGGGLMALSVDPVSGGRYDVEVNGFYKFEPFPTPDPNDEPDDMILPAAKTVDVDPTGVAGDERFVVVFDLFVERDGNGETFDGIYGPGVVIEFSYDDASGSLTPVSAPLLGQSPLPNQPIGGLDGLYDSDGNFWAKGSGWPTTGFLGVYPKTNGQRELDDCGFVPGTPLGDYTTDDPVSGDRVWGKVCQPHYEIVQARPFTQRWGGTLMLTEDPATKTMVAHDYWHSGALAVRRTGEGESMSFEVGNVVDTGETRLAPGVEENRPGVFDSSGRYWFVSPGQTPPVRDCAYDALSPLGRLCPAKPAYFSQTHWMQSIDVAQLFATPPVVLPATTPETAARVEAEATATTATAEGSPSNGVVPVTSTAAMRRLPVGGPEDTGDAGFELLGGSSGTVEYKVWVPVAGNYRLNYRVHGSGGIQAAVGTTTYPTTSVTNANRATPASATTTGPTLQLPAGHQTIRLSATGGSTWALNWFTLTRL